MAIAHSQTSMLTDTNRETFKWTIPEFQESLKAQLKKEGYNVGELPPNEGASLDPSRPEARGFIVS